MGTLKSQNRSNLNCRRAKNVFSSEIKGCGQGIYWNLKISAFLELGKLLNLRMEVFGIANRRDLMSLKREDELIWCRRLDARIIHRGSWRMDLKPSV
jgi:hypothetical protein